MSEAIQSCTIEVRVRYPEADAFGYLHHANYFVFLEMGRTELLRVNGVRYRDMEQRGVYYVVARIECRYRAPARYDDVLRIRTTTTRLTRVRVDHRYEVLRDDTLLAEASSTVVCVGRDGRPMGLPEDLYDRLAGSRVAQNAS